MKAISPAFLIIARQGEMNVFPKKIHSHNIVIRNFTFSLAAAAAEEQQSPPRPPPQPTRTTPPFHPFLYFVSRLCFGCIIMTLIKSSNAEMASNGGKYPWLPSNSLESPVTIQGISFFFFFSFFILAAAILYTAEWKYYRNNNL